jgi:RNase P subunit RPR2
MGQRRRDEVHNQMTEPDKAEQVLHALTSVDYFCDKCLKHVGCTADWRFTPHRQIGPIISAHPDSFSSALFECLVCGHQERYRVHEE